MMDRHQERPPNTSSMVAWMLLAGLLAGVIGCGAPQPDPVALAVSAERQGDRLTIGGEANVPDGAWVVYAAYLKRQPRQRIRGAVPVRDGVYHAEGSVAGWPAGAIVVDVHFQIPVAGIAQPARVVKRYGSKGERITGPGVIEAGEGSRVAIASATVGTR